MSYPSGPYPQQPSPGFPQANAVAPQPPTGGAGHPGYPGGVDPAAAAPGGGTTTTAAILAVVGGVAQLAYGLGTILRIPMLDYERGTILIPFVRLLAGGLMFVGGVVLVVGAIMLFTRKPVGRLLVMIGCGVIILVLLLDLVFELVRFLGELSITNIPGMLGVFAFPAATLVLVMLGATKRHLAIPRPNPRFVQPQLGQQQLGQPQPGQPQLGQPPQAGYPQPQPGPQPQPAYPQQQPSYPPRY